MSVFLPTSSFAHSAVAFGNRAMSTAIAALAMLTATASHTAFAQQKTVCTITVNSSDEKEMFRQRLPADKFRFVELVERGRPDWLASACRTGVQCDVLVISGHFAGTNFFSEDIDAQEFLPVDEMERVSCSESCPGLFSKLKEVYLFGCNTLNAEAGDPGTTPMTRVSAGPGDVLRDARTKVNRGTERFDRLAGEESNRERMRRIFSNVPVIYGFSAKAPVGESAAGILKGYLKNTGGREIGNGRVSPSLLGAFKGSSMTAASGLRERDAQAGYRDQVCQFFDERLAPAQKLDFVHQILDRKETEVRRFLDHIEKFTTSLSAAQQSAPTFAQQLNEIAGDDTARKRFVALMRIEPPLVRARMIKLAATFGWLTSDAQRGETLSMVRDVLAAPRLDASDVEFVCALNDDHDLDEDSGRFRLSPEQTTSAGHQAALACLGDRDSHQRVVQALTGSSVDDSRVAQVYLRHRPISNPSELRAVANAIARMDGADAKVVALDTLARHYISDRQSLEELVVLFGLSDSISVQRAIAGILIRSDYRSIARPELARTLAQRRVRSTDGEDVIDMLIRRLASS